MKTAVACKKARGGQGPAGLGPWRPSRGLWIPGAAGAIRAVLNRSASSALEAIGGYVGIRLQGQRWKLSGGLWRWSTTPDHTGSREMESSGWQPAEGLMWEARRKNQGALGFRLELLGRAGVCRVFTELAMLRDGAYAGLHPCQSLTSFLAGFTSSGNS